MGCSLFSVTCWHMDDSNFQHTPVTHAAMQHCKCSREKTGGGINMCRSIVRAERRRARLSNSKPGTWRARRERFLHLLDSLSISATISKEEGQKRLVLTNHFSFLTAAAVTRRASQYSTQPHWRLLFVTNKTLKWHLPSSLFSASVRDLIFWLQAKSQESVKPRQTGLKSWMIVWPPLIMILHTQRRPYQCCLYCKIKNRKCIFKH